MTKTSHIQIRTSPEEKTRWTEAAAGDLSTFIREVVNNHLAYKRTGEVLEVTTVEARPGDIPTRTISGKRTFSPDPK
jgi:hypothetical protein